ncbi:MULTISPECIES: preprotein translocase subunit YajC [Streptomycetaceae]|uniref:Secreted protein n=1 Tax=Streptantibioticus cattleyicolor (strain ATCC 35852 / DSM 46488 / JCM 4925 / NBRC 14057 / NRRL 8057) TaxID=1003195 RepID=F8K4V5_STREN|nr:preprotein translocase subunit YajC [Streptantibioticus cattleyicolor]AEW97674.1 secreted protein [Streptantibioticus cattleyicolor NRRL 8057 = DSM 46488]MYS62100.1 preprotein translocase subunit YajC [Streptomyces sp. SID5468]CCB77994.1 Secreted protein [Streptantibioticus cattleyicolor NRRL 8057 = DSM 46488]
MNYATFLPFILIIGVMFLMTRSAKNKQRQAAQMRDQMQPGSGVRTIGGMIARVKEVRDTTVLLEIEPGVHALFAKTAVATVLPDEEFERLVSNDVPLTFEEPSAADATPGDAGDEPHEAAAEETDATAGPSLVKDTADEKDATKDAKADGK